MRIAIIGAGNVGGTLGLGWAKKGHDVVFGVRDPGDAKAREAVAAGGGKARAASVAEAARGAEVVVLATPWAATRDALAAAGDLRGKVVLDCTNPLKADLSGLEVGHTTSGAEQIAAALPTARVVKIFNSTGANNMADPRFPEGRATMLYCGDDANAKSAAHKLAADLGFDPVDAGPLKQARLLEPLAMLWISLAYAGGHGREIAFRLMKR